MVAKPRRGSLGYVDYAVHDVAGDGNCYYRAVYQLIYDVPAARIALGIRAGGDEDRAVRDLRATIARYVKQLPEANAAIDNLCELAAASEDIADELAEMYPFLADDVCAARGRKRYRLVADKIIASPPLFASALEHHVVQCLLAASANLSLIVLSVPAVAKISPRRREIWKNDLRNSLRNATTRKVAVLLNVDNIHYQYVALRGSDDAADHTILSRQKLLALLDLTAPPAAAPTAPLASAPPPATRRAMTLSI